MKPPSFGASFGLLVKNRRAGKKLSQNNLADVTWPRSYDSKDHPRKAEISRLERGHIATPQEKTVLALCEALGIREDEVNALRLAPPPDPYGLAKVLADLKSASQADLYALARAFGDDAPEDRSDTALRSFLADKAKEHANYQKIIAALDDRVAAIANLKGAAQDAAARLDFDEVESLLCRVHEVELDIAAATAEARAENALMQGKDDHAFTLFSAAADSLAIIATASAFEKRCRFAQRLIHQGTRHGGPALRSAIRILEPVLHPAVSQCLSETWVRAQNLLGTANVTIGRRSIEPQGSEFISRAVLAFEAARGKDRDASKEQDSASTTHNLSYALVALGERTPGRMGQIYLVKAIRLGKEALTFRNRRDVPLLWARTTFCIAMAYEKLGSKIGGMFGLRLLHHSVEQFRLSMEERTKINAPLQWAITMANLGCAYESILGVAPVESREAAYLQAIYCGAMARYQFIKHERPVLEAIALGNLARSEYSWSMCPLNADRPAHLSAALQHVDGALKTFASEDLAFYHEKATRLREAILSALGQTP